MNVGEIREKTERLMKWLAAENLGGVLINSQTNFAWLTGGANNGIDQSRENGTASILIRNDGRRFVLASRIEMPRVLAEEISPEFFEPIEFAWEAEKAATDFLPNLAVSLLSENKSLGADLPFGANVQVVEGAIAVCRYQLTETEIERYRVLGKDAGRIVGNLCETLEPGQSETEIARLVAAALAEKDIRSVVTLVAADERLENFRHPIPTAKRWTKTVMIVVCAKRQGLIASLSRIVCNGAVPEDLQRKTVACANVNARLWRATEPNATGVQLYQVAADAYEAQGFAGEINRHHQGGATGYRTRDWTAHPTSAEIVKINQAFAWNPSISGAKTEETVICLEKGVEIVTASPNFPTVTVQTDGREYHFPGVLSV